MHTNTLFQDLFRSLGGGRGQLWMDGGDGRHTVTEIFAHRLLLILGVGGVEECKRGDEDEEEIEDSGPCWRASRSASHGWKYV